MTTPVTVTWWGHATTTIALAGVRVLTDPVLTRHVAHLRRIAGPSPVRAALEADMAVVSHLHLDHLHAPSLSRLSPHVRIVAPRGAAAVLRRSTPDLARRVEEVDVGDAVDLGDVTLHAVPASHGGRRSPISRHSGPTLGFVLHPTSEKAGTTVWFAGDTGLFDAMAQIGPVDVAVLPIGGWGPTLGPTHLDPEQAAEAVRRVGAHDAVPIHYATLWPIGLQHLHPASFRRHFTEPGTRFVENLASVCPRATAHLLPVGGSITIDGTLR